jgi:hypothetical protein
MLRFRTALSVLALIGTASAAAAQTVVVPAAPSDPVTTGTVTVPAGTAGVQTVYPAAPGPYGDSRGLAPDVPNPSAAPSGQNPAVDDGLPFTSDD